MRKFILSTIIYVIFSVILFIQAGLNINESLGYGILTGFLFGMLTAIYQELYNINEKIK